VNKIDISGAIAATGKAIQNSPLAYHIRYKKNDRIDIKKLDRVCFIQHGFFSFFRDRDNILTLSCEGPTVVGIAQLISPIQTHYIRCETDCDIWVIKTQDAINLFNQKNLWSQAFNILADLTQQYFERDYLISQKNSRDIVLEHLRFIWNLPAQERGHLSVYSYIMKRNFLSRSIIHKIISELNDENLIEMKRGKLIEFKL
jgi:hypothetical protein